MTIRAVGASAALVFLFLTAVQAGEPPVEVCGDVNDSGSLSSADALLVLKGAVGQPVSLVCPAIDALEMCQGDSCGDGVVNAVGEQCDGVDLNGADCTSLSYELGALACDGSCRFDATGCSKCTGLVYEGSCWFLGSVGEACGEVCAKRDQVYDAATRTVVGSDGTDDACEKVLDGLGAPGSGLEYPSYDCSSGTGCEEENGIRGRCATPATTSSAVYVEAERACACTSECEGVIYHGACWFLGENGESCEQVCAGLGKSYNDATRFVAGSDGTDQDCENLFDALGAPGTGLQYPSFACGLALGCEVEGVTRGRCASPPTTSGAASNEGARVCACE